MPQLLTKHPDVAKQVLESAGAVCGGGQPQEILTDCPEAQFCKLSGGELCVYGVEEVGAMTQISTDNLAEQVCSTSGGCQLASAGGMPALLVGVLAGVALGVRRRRGRRRE